MSKINVRLIDGNFFLVLLVLCHCLKSWPNGLASQHKFSTCVQLAFRLATHLRWLWSSSNSHESRRNFFCIGWPLNASRHTLIASQVYMREIYDLRELASRLANPFGHPLLVRTQVLVLQTCVDFRRLASSFGQRLNLTKSDQTASVHFFCG